MVEYFENYGPFVTLIQNRYMDLYTKDITPKNYVDYFNGLLNIMRDGIEDPEVQSLKIGIHLDDGNYLRLTIPEFYFQLIFWTFPIYIKDPITVIHLIDTRQITKRTIKEYFNMLIKLHSKDVDFITLNNLIDETIYKFKYIDEFAMYLSNTVNFKDTLDLMEKYPEFNQSIHADLSNIPIEDVKDIGMKYTQTQINYIKNNDHCLRDSFISQEAISPKQFKEVSVNIGTKPDGHGGIFPYIINNSFMNGGVSNPESYVIDSSVGRTAQILQKMNVGTSGAFARLLETNNLDTFFNPDSEYSCDTKNFIKVFIKDSNWLSKYDKRYYKFNPDGIDYLLDKDRDYHLIGQTLYFRSPITCASYAHGNGICKKCYGDLYYVNRDINPGKIAAELLSSKYTQMLLSAKHLLESSVIEMKWNSEFFDIFELNLNMISIQEDVELDGYYMILDSNKFTSDDEDDSEDSAIQYEEYTPSFDIRYPNGNIINREKDTSSYTKDEIVKEFITANMDGGIDISAIHLETIVSNQMRDPEDILSMPNWSVKNAPYKILTLGSALNNSPSITVNLEYQRIGKTLISPLSTRKRKPSVFDLYFMEKPQNYLENNDMVSDKYNMIEDNEVNKLRDAIYFIDNEEPNDCDN